MQSVLDMVSHEAQRNVNILRNSSARGAYIADCRNKIVEGFLNTTAEWLLFLDIDMVFAPDLVEALLSAANDEDHERKILAGFYLTPTAQKPCSAWLVYGPNGKLQTIGSFNVGEVKEVASVGMGGTLIHRSVLEAFPLAADDWRWFGHDLIDGVRHGEDVTFCLRAAGLGFKSYGVGWVQMGHIKSHVLDTAILKAA